ncbi:MAG: electron transfer flavoprotein subunit alpha/FixB family protein [Myxococcota bacterium]|nr:electron transfer flavoprotein subunit alpha/FixB family protein [Myxococcota bacterium]
MSSGILVFCEHENGVFKKTAHELLAKASALVGDVGGEVSAVVIGGPTGAELGGFGAARVYSVQGDAFSQHNTGAWVSALAAVVGQADPAVLLGAASSAGRDLFPRLSARLSAGMASEVTDLSVDGGQLVATRPIYAGKAFTQVRITSSLGLYTVRPNSFTVPDSNGAVADEVAVAVEVGAGAERARVVEVMESNTDTVDLTEADRIVSGGRSLKSSDGFDDVIVPLARSLGATPGASRAAVDAGYVPHSWQVGQTGKVVNPSVYIACGISGAIQHLAGMRTSKVIVAINKDPDAPIFQHATYGIVDDLFEVCPVLAKAFENALS